MFPYPKRAANQSSIHGPTLVLASATAVLASLAGCAADSTAPPSPTASGTVAVIATPSPSGSPAPSQPTTRTPPADLARVLDGVVSAGVPGVLLSIDDVTTGTTTMTAGVSDLKTKAPLDPNSHFRIGGITQTFVAVVVLQLVAEKRLGLDQEVNAVIPQLVSGQGKTIRMLLAHTASMEESAAPSIAAVVLQPTKVWSPDDVLRTARSLGPTVIPPGSEQVQGNVGYLALGKVIEKVTGQPLPAELRRRIFVPLGLTQTSWPTSTQIPAPHPRGYTTLRSANLDHQDITELDVTFPGAAGALVSTTHDLKAFVRALTTGELVGPALYAEMTHPFSSSGALIGLGLEMFSGCGQQWVGYAAGAPGFISMAASTIDGRRQLAIVENYTDDGETPPAYDAAQEALLKGLLCA